MDYTENLSLGKPEKAEQYDVTVLNNDLDAIDAYAGTETAARKAADDGLQKQIDENRLEERRIGTVPVSKGGTGETTAQGALNALHGGVEEAEAVGEEDEITFLRRTAADPSTGTPPGVDVESVKLSALAQKVYDLMRGDTELFSATRNGLVPKAGSAGHGAFLSAAGIWDVPIASEDVIIATTSKTYTISSNMTIRIRAEQKIALVVEDGARYGIKLTIHNETDIVQNLSCNSMSEKLLLNVEPHTYNTVVWNGAAWENVSCPVAPGDDKVQYPGTPEPADLYPCTAWEEIDFGGAFFRATGGNAEAYGRSLVVDSVSGTTLTFAAAHGLAVGQVLHDPAAGESRLVATVPDATTVTLSEAFARTDLTGVLVAQMDCFQGHEHRTQLTWTVEANAGPYKKAGRGDTLTTEIVEKSGYGTPRYGIETRPVNFAVRIWRRTA